MHAACTLFISLPRFLVIKKISGNNWIYAGTATRYVYSNTFFLHDSRDIFNELHVYIYAHYAQKSIIFRFFSTEVFVV